MSKMSDIIAFFHDSFLLFFFQSVSASTTLRPPKRSEGGLRLIPSSGGASTAEGGVTVQASGKEVSCGLELVPDESEPQEPSSHGVFGVFVLLGFGACGAYLFRHLAECEAKLDVTLKLSCVESVLLISARCVELEEAELNRAFRKSGVGVGQMVAAAVVMLVPSVA